MILAFAIGNAVGPNLISDVDNFNGESHDAEAALDRAGLRPQSEVVFIQSDELTIKDPEFKAGLLLARFGPQVTSAEVTSAA